MSLVTHYNQYKKAFLIGSSFLYLFLSCGSGPKHDPEAAENRLSPREERIYVSSDELAGMKDSTRAGDKGSSGFPEGSPESLPESEAKQKIERNAAPTNKSWFAPVLDPIKKILPKKKKDPGVLFVEAYQADYQTIAKEVLLVHEGGKKWGCAAYASTALKHFGLPIEQVLVTNQLEQQFISLGYKKVNLSLLKPGDVVFTTKKDSNLKDTYSHVFVHGRYTGPLRRESLAIDNYTSEYIRPLGGNKDYSKAVVAYRPDY